MLREYRGGKHVQRRLAAADDDLPADGVSVLSWTEAAGTCARRRAPNDNQAGPAHSLSGGSGLLRDAAGRGSSRSGHLLSVHCRRA